ncbi:MAG TPA: hypothetical protein VGB82_27400 [Alphaproteobacteria bacterium]
MKTVQDYLQHEALARKSTSPEQRKLIAHMAETWRMLAEQRRKKLAKKPA